MCIRDRARAQLQQARLTREQNRSRGAPSPSARPFSGTRNPGAKPPTQANPKAAEGGPAGPTVLRARRMA
eukprot:1279480-Alexandrium_andersonii.AAC.1